MYSQNTTELKKPKRHGTVTLPAEAGKENETIELFDLWGADAIRDSDGTRLSPEILKMGYPVYSTLCLVRLDDQWAKTHPEELVQKYLMSEQVTATENCLEIDLLAKYFHKKYKVDAIHNPKEWWEVINRTTAEVVPTADWEYHEQTHHSH